MVDTDAPQKSVRVSNSGSGGGFGGGGGGESVNWWRYSPSEDTITFLKRIASGVFDRLRITSKLIFGNSDDADTYVTGIADDNTAETSTHDIVTPNYGKEKYLSKTHDDTAQGWITVLQGIRTLETFLENAETGGGLFTDSQNRAQLVADVAKIRDKVLGSLTIEDALSVLGALNVHNSPNTSNSFADGTTISNYIAKLNGNARIDETLVALAGMYVNVIKSMNYNGDGPFDAGWMMTNNKNGHSYLVVDELFVRMKAIFTELEIRKIIYAGGNFVFSHAGSKTVAVKSLSKKIAVAVAGTIATITGPVNVIGQVLNIDGGVTVSGTVATLTDNPVTYAYRCYAMKDDGTTATENWWHVNDQARCQAFNVVEPGHYENIENTFYWRRIINVGYEKISLTEGQTEENYDYVDLSIADCASGSGAPQAGDSIVQMGNRTDTDRMGFISLEVYGDDAPAIKVYKNVNGYTLNNKRKICISPKYTELHLQKMVIETEYDAQPVAMERGPWDDIPGHRCYYYNVVQHNGSSWLCIYPEEGIGGVMYTTEEPSENATYWQYYAKAGKDGKDGNSFNIVDTIDNVSELPATGEEGQAYIVKINGIGYLYVWSVADEEWKDSGQIQGDPGRGIQSVTVSYGNSDSASTLPTTWSGTPSPQQGKYLWTKTVLNYTDNTTSEPSYSVSYNGTDGTSPIMIAVDNPIMSIACDKDGHALAAVTKTVNVTLYNGNELVALTGIDCTTATGIAIQNKSAQNHSFQIVIAQGAYIDQANNLVASATATIDGETVSRSIPITVNGIRQGADGQPAAKVELNDYMVDVECDENGNATEAFSEEIIPQILADNKQLYISSIAVGSHANVSTPSYYASPMKTGVMSVSGTIATINGVSSVSGTVATLPAKVIALPHIVVNVAKGGSVTEGNVSVNVTGADNNGKTFSAGNNFAIVRNYYAPALQVVLSPEVLILTQDETTKQIDLSQAYTDVVMRIGATNITNGLEITAQPSQVGDRPTCSASVNGNRVSITAINTTAAGSGVYFDKGYIDIHVTYQGNVYTQRFSFYCNLLGTWKEQVENDTKTAIAQSTLTEFTDGEIVSTQRLGEFIASSKSYETKLTQKVLDANGNVIESEGSVYKQTYDAIKLAVGDTGVDIENQKITAKANNFEIKNNNNQKTFGIDDNGNLVATGDGKFDGNLQAQTMYTPTMVLDLDSDTDIWLFTTSHGELYVSNTFLLTNAVNTNPQTTIHLPFARVFDGLEICFFHPVLRSQHVGVGFLYCPSSDLYVKDNNIYILESAYATAHGHHYPIPKNVLLRVRAINGSWYVIE